MDGGQSYAEVLTQSRQTGNQTDKRQEGQEKAMEREGFLDARKKGEEKEDTGRKKAKTET